MARISLEKKRQNERFSVEIPVEFRNKQKMIEARVANIGTGGMCVKTSEVLPVRSQSFFRIVSKDGTLNFNIEAEVMWSQPQSRIRQRRNKRPGLMGLRFVKSRFLTEAMISGIILEAAQPPLV
jgi:hypothetical protein